jgi:hypothetical protein
VSARFINVTITGGHIGDTTYNNYPLAHVAHVDLVAIVRAIAEVDPAAVNDVVDHLDRATVDEAERVTVEDFRELIGLVAGLQRIVDFLVRHALRTGDVAAGDHAAMRDWMERHG